MNLSSSLASAYTEASTPIWARRAPSLFAKAKTRLSSFPRAEKRADHGPFARGIKLWVWIRLKMLAQPALEASSTRDDGMKARKAVCVDSGIAWEMVKPRGEWLILSFLLSISSAKMISDFKVKNRSPPLKKKYQQLGIYQMHWHIASQVSKALYHESKSPYSGQASHRPWAYPWRHYLTFWQEGAFTIWAEKPLRWYDILAIQALALKNSWSKERRLGWDGNSIRQLWSKRVGCFFEKKLFYSAALSVKLPSPHYLLTTRLAS